MFDEQMETANVSHTNNTSSTSSTTATRKVSANHAVISGMRTFDASYAGAMGSGLGKMRKTSGIIISKSKIPSMTEQAMIDSSKSPFWVHKQGDDKKIRRHVGGSVGRISDANPKSETDLIIESKAQLSASQQSKAMVTNKNKSLLIELETTKQQVKAAKEATKTAVNAAALATTSSASSSSTAMDTVENDRLKKELNTMKLELKKARQQSVEPNGNPSAP